MLIKTFFMTMSFLYIKFLIVATVILFLYINRESNKLLKKEYKRGESRYTNYCIRPKILDTIPRYMPSLKMLYYAIWNKIFNLTYMKILVGIDNFWFKVLKSIKKIEIFKSLVYIILGLNKFIIKIFIEIFKFDSKSIEEYLFRTFKNPSDDRIIVKINNKWEINGSTQKIIKKIEELLERKMSHQNFDLLRPHLYLKMEVIRERLLEIDNEYLCYNAKFVHIKNKVQHSTFIGISKIDLSYQTDFSKSIKKNNYNEIPVVKKYKGTSKVSTLLPIKEEYMKPVDDPELKSCFKQVQGAILYGYEDKNVSIKFEEQIKEVRELSSEWENLLEEIGVGSIESKELLEEFFNDIL